MLNIGLGDILNMRQNSYNILEKQVHRIHNFAHDISTGHYLLSLHKHLFWGTFLKKQLEQILAVFLHVGIRRQLALGCRGNGKPEVGRTMLIKRV